MPLLSFIEIAAIVGAVGVIMLAMARRLQTRIHRDEWTKPITFQSDLARADRISLMSMGYLFGSVFCAVSIFFFIMDCLQ